MGQDVTLDEVASKSGVSRATASRALNNRDGVRDDVRERVRMIAESLGYRPNRAARNLAGGQSSVIGLVLGEGDIVVRPYAMALMQEVARAADDQDQAVVLILETKDPSERVKEIMADGLVDGIIVSIVATNSPWVEQLLDTTLPAVIIGSPGTRFEVPVVDVENIDSTATIVGHLLDTGHRRVATITGPLNRRDSSRRLEGYQLAFEQRSIPVDESLIVVGDFSRQRGYDLSGDLLDRGADAIFCANDEMARGVYYRAIERGLSIPDDFGLAGFDGTTLDRFDFPSITSVIQPYPEMADTAVELLMDRMAGRECDEVRILEPELFHGSTTRSPQTEP